MAGLCDIDDDSMLPPALGLFKYSSGSMTPLHVAIRQGDILEITRLIGSGEDYNAVNSSGATPLIFAAKERKPDIVLLLLDLCPNIDLNVQDFSVKETALHYAVDCGANDCVEALLKRGAKNLPDYYGRTPLLKAFRHMDLDMECLFLDYIQVDDLGYRDLSTCGQTALHYAVEQKLDYTKIGSLIHDGVCNIQDYDKKTPLMYAIKNGYDEIYDLLLSKLTTDDINVKDNKGDSHLNYAVKYGKVQLVEKLFAMGAKNTINKEGHTTLMLSIKKHNQEIVKLCCAYLSEYINDTDGVGNTALCFAVTDKNIYNIKALIDHGSENIPNWDSKTPLMKSIVSTGYGEITKLILNSTNLNKHINAQNKKDRYNTALHYGFSCLNKEGDLIEFTQLMLKNGVQNLTNEDGMTPFLLAVKFGKKLEKVLDLLLEQRFFDGSAGSGSDGAVFGEITASADDKMRLDINARDNDDNAAVHIAMFTDNAMSTLKKLLDNGADIHVRNKKGQTVLMLAAQHGQKDVVTWLFENSLGGDINYQDADGNTALHMVDYKKPSGNEIAEILIEYYAKNIPDHADITPFFKAVCDASKSVIDLFFQRKLVENINHCDIYGHTALYYAVSGVEKQYCVEKLIKYGAKNLGTKGGVSPFIFAVQSCAAEVIDIFLRYGIVTDLNVEDSVRLFYNLRYEPVYICNKLVKLGMNIWHSTFDSKEDIRVLRKYQDGTRGADDSDEYKTAMHNILYRLLLAQTNVLWENILQKDAVIKDLVSKNKCLQSAIAKGYVSDETVVKIFDGDISRFFIKCKGILGKEIHLKYANDIVHDVAIPAEIRKLAIWSAMSEDCELIYGFDKSALLSNEFYLILEYYDCYKIVVNNPDTNIADDGMSLLDVMKLKQKNLEDQKKNDAEDVKNSDKYQLVVNEYEDSKKKYALAWEEYENGLIKSLDEWIDRLGKKALPIVRAVVGIYPELWEEYSQKYEELQVFKSHYAFEFALNIDARLQNIFNANIVKDGEDVCISVCRVDTKALVLASKHSSQVKVDVANYCATKYNDEIQYCYTSANQTKESISFIPLCFVKRVADVDCCAVSEEDSVTLSGISKYWGGALGLQSEINY